MEHSVFIFCRGVKGISKKQFNESAYRLTKTLVIRSVHENISTVEYPAHILSMRNAGLFLVALNQFFCLGEMCFNRKIAFGLSNSTGNIVTPSIMRRIGS